MGIGDFIRDRQAEGMSNEDILPLVKAQFPEARTTINSIRWYRTNPKKGLGKPPMTTAMAHSMRTPRLEPLDQYFSSLAQMVAKTSWLPHPDTVHALGRAAFPTARARKKHPRFSFICDNGKRVGMYDDNTTPRWAILGAHGISTWNDRRGWSFSHVWPSPASDDINSFSHLANLVMIPECFASLTDKNGPLTGYLRWHAKKIYGWKPDYEEPQMPVDYNNVQWRYFSKFDEPRTFINQRLDQLNNQWSRPLKEIAKNNSSLPC